MGCRPRPTLAPRAHSPSQPAPPQEWERMTIPDAWRLEPAFRLSLLPDGTTVDEAR